jgi:HlyD family secretion protein
MGENDAPMRRLLLPLALLGLAACQKPPSDSLQGYVEGEFVLLASPYAGQLQKLYVHRGDRIDAGKPVFALEQESERQARVEAEQNLKSAEARLADLQVPRRQPEIDTMRAQVAQAKAAADLSALQLEQGRKLFKGGFIAQNKLDELRKTHERDVARIREADAQLQNVQQPLGREAERQKAEADSAAAKAQLAQAGWRLEQKSVAAPLAGLVQDTFFVEGEWVPAGRPVASLLPPGNVKVRFYVPETVLGSIQPGRAVEISCDGCPEPIPAKVTYLSSQAEYTPPVLYTREQRSKLMFLIEARPEPARATGLRPGQPVDIRLQ